MQAAREKVLDIRIELVRSPASLDFRVAEKGSCFMEIYRLPQDAGCQAYAAWTQYWDQKDPFGKFILEDGERGDAWNVRMRPRTDVDHLIAPHPVQLRVWENEERSAVLKAHRRLRRQVDPIPSRTKVLTSSKARL